MELSHEPQIIDELFRKVRSEEILEDLKELGVDVRDHTLKSPSAEEALGLYGLAIQVVLGKTRVDIRPEDVCSHINVFSSSVEGLEITKEDLEFLKRGIGNLRFWRYCQKLHHVLGLPEIERYELFNPTPESFYRFISAFVVYLRFREALKALFEDAVARLDFFAEQESQLEDSVHRVKEEFMNFQRLKEDNLLDLEASVEDRERLEKLLLQAKAAFNEHKDTKTKVETEIEKAKIAINDIQLKRTRLRHSNESLSEQILSNPEALYNQKNNMETHNATQTANLKSLMGSYEQVKQRVTHLKQCNVFLVATKDKLGQHLQHVLRPLIEHSNAAKTLRSRNEFLNSQIKHHKVKRDEAHHTLMTTKTEHEERLRLAQENAENHLNAARKMADDTKEHVKRIKQQISHNNKEIDLLKVLLSKKAETIDGTFRIMEENLKKVTLSSTSYSKGMNSLMKEIQKIVSTS